MSYSNILKVLDKRGISYKLDGQDAKVSCLNPDHDDNDPSLRIDVSTGQYNCFGCGFKGQSILKYLGEDVSRVSLKVAKVIKEINNIKRLSRGLEIPLSAQLWDKEFRGIPKEVLEKHKAFCHLDYGIDRLSFPITDSTGKVVNVVSRRMHSKINPKYIVYPPETSVPLYPFVKSNNVILVEGIFDMFNLQKYGVDNVVATFGGKSLTKDNIVDKLRPFLISGTNIFFILFDNDNAGLKSADQLKQLIETKTECKAYILNPLLPKDKDPGDLELKEVFSIIEEIDKIIDSHANTAL